MSRVKPVASFDPILKTIHWATVALLLIQLATGWIMTGLDTLPRQTLSGLYALHKSFGMLVLLLTFVRLPWRLAHAQPRLPASLRPWEAFLAILVERLFYVLLFLQTFSGWAIYSISPYKALFFGTRRIPDLPFLGGLAGNEAAKDLLEGIHRAGAALLAGLIVLHAGAALKHHFIERDEVLLRMTPKALWPWLGRLRADVRGKRRG